MACEIAKRYEPERRRFLQWAGSMGAVLGLETVTPKLVSAGVPKLMGAAEEERFSHPRRIRYDRRCFYVENQPTIIFSGSFHYFRCAPPMWPRIFSRIAAAGFNAVETYVAWNLHEPRMPRDIDDLSGVDLSELESWLQMAFAHGLHVIIRPGPYICAETNTGGLPRWLLTKKPLGWKGRWFRSDDAASIAWSLHWYRAVCPLLARHQLTRKAVGEKGIILLQLENEYNYSGHSWAQGRRYIAALGRCALASGIEVPMFTNDSNCIIGSADPVLRGLFDGQDWYPGGNVTGTLKDIRHLRQAQRNAPVTTPELQGGWFDAAVWAPSLRTNSDNYAGLGPRQINNLTQYVLAHGVKMLNYYMLFGGTNFSHVAGRDIATSYDYSAAIRECGGVGSKYRAVQALGRMLQRHGAGLARATKLNLTTSGAADPVEFFARRSPDGDAYLFVRNSDRHKPAVAKAHLALAQPDGRSVDVHLSLEPFEAKVLWLPPGAAPAQARWLPEPPLEHPRLPRRDLPLSVGVKHVRVTPEPQPRAFKTVKPGQTLEALGLFDHYYVWYRMSAWLTAEQLHSAGPWVLVGLSAGRGSAVAEINGIYVPPLKNVAKPQFVFDAQPAIRTGWNQIVLLYESDGNRNVGPELEQYSGMTDLILTSEQPSRLPGPMQHGKAGPTLRAWSFDSPQARRGALQISSWRQGYHQRWMAPAYDEKSWATLKLPAANRSAPGMMMWYRFHFTLPAIRADAWVPWCLRLYASGNGFIYLNGHNLGRYWGGLGQREFYLPEGWLHCSGDNVISLALCSMGGVAGIQSVDIVPYDVYAELAP